MFKFMNLHKLYNAPTEGNPGSSGSGGNNPNNGTPNSGEGDPSKGDNKQLQDMLNRNKEGDVKPSANQNPEQNKPADKFAGKSPEDIINMYKELESLVGDLRTKASQAEELENLLYQMLNQQQGENQAAPETQEAPFISQDEAMELFKDPATFLQKFAKKVIEESQKSTTQSLEEKQAQKETAEKLRTNFYSSYEDLKGAEIIVGPIAAAVQQANPRVSPEKLFPKIAEIARQEINKIRGVNQNITPPAIQDPPGSGGAIRNFQEPAQGNSKEILDLVKSRR